MKGLQNNSLPFSLELAAKTYKLDYIKIIPVTNYLPVKKRFFSIKIGNYKNRLLNKASKFINKDISYNLSKNNSVKFHVYIMGHLKDFKLFVIPEHSYKIY